MSVALRKIASHANKCGCTIMFINQLRYKVREVLSGCGSRSAAVTASYACVLFERCYSSFCPGLVMAS